MGIQKADIVMLNSAAMNKRVCSGVMVGPRMDHLLVASTTASLSQWTSSSRFSHWGCHKRKA